MTAAASLARCLRPGALRASALASTQQFAALGLGGAQPPGLLAQLGLPPVAALLQLQQQQQQPWSSSARALSSLARASPWPQQSSLSQGTGLAQPPRASLAALALPLPQGGAALRAAPWQLQQGRGFVLMPRRIKYRKVHKSVGFNDTRCPNTRQLAFGLYGIRAMEHCRMPARTLEAIRRTLRRTIKKSAMLWIRITPNVPVTSKPAEVRMGKGKGSLDYWACPVRPGQILFEMDRVPRGVALEAMQAIKAKMPIRIGFVEWN